MSKITTKPKASTGETMSFGGKTYVVVEETDHEVDLDGSKKPMNIESIAQCKPEKRARGSKTIPIGLTKNITIRKFSGQPQINIRGYTRDSSGRQYSTKRGILLTPEEWRNLKESFSSVDEYLRERQGMTEMD